MSPGRVRNAICAPCGTRICASRHQPWEGSQHVFVTGRVADVAGRHQTPEARNHLWVRSSRARQSWSPSAQEGSPCLGGAGPRPARGSSHRPHLVECAQADLRRRRLHPLTPTRYASTIAASTWFATGISATSASALRPWCRSPASRVPGKGPYTRSHVTPARRPDAVWRAQYWPVAPVPTRRRLPRVASWGVRQYRCSPLERHRPYGPGRPRTLLTPASATLGQGSRRRWPRGLQRATKGPRRSRGHASTRSCGLSRYASPVGHRACAVPWRTY